MWIVKTLDIEGFAIDTNECKPFETRKAALAYFKQQVKAGRKAAKENGWVVEDDTATNFEAWEDGSAGENALYVTLEETEYADGRKRSKDVPQEVHAVVDNICNMLYNNITLGYGSEMFEGWCENGKVFGDGVKDKAVAIMREVAPAVDKITQVLEKHIGEYQEKKYNN